MTTPHEGAPASRSAAEQTPVSAEVNDDLARLRAAEREHPFWNNSLLAGFKAGAFDRDELRYIFSQYALFSRNFTRFLAALMANCESDLFRAKLSENLWEEGGGGQAEKRHSELFRQFLRGPLGVVEPDAVQYEAYTRHFVRECLVFCLRSEPAAGSAFLSLGGEGIVARMYSIFVEGMTKVGLRDEELEFFHIHIACDDGHAETLEEMMLSYSAQPGWFETCLKAMNHSLTLRAQFCEDVVEGLRSRRWHRVVDPIRARKSLADTPSALRHRPTDEASTLYANKIDHLNLEFSVDRLPFAGEVLDPRTVRIPPGKCNENHRHAHETFMHFLEGTAVVTVDGVGLEVQPGDSVFVPRWSLHQTRNTGTSHVRFVAVTDFNLTSRVTPGDAEGYRMKAPIKER